MKKTFTTTFITTFVMVMAMFVGTSCDDRDDIYDSLPTKVSEFISHYYPNTKVAGFMDKNDGCTVVLDGGPTLTFNSAYVWTSVNGNGSVLPQVFLFDQLPPSLYEYLQTQSALDSVFVVSRTDKVYKVKLLKTTLNYDIETGKITGESTLPG